MRRAPDIAVLIAAMLLGCPAPKPDPKAQADGLYLAGSSEFLEGDFEEALAHFREVRRLNPADPRLPAAIGEVHLAEGRLADALEEFQAAAALEPKRATNWGRLGLLHALRGERERALQALEKAIALNPADFRSLEQLGELAAAGGDTAGAARRFEQAAGAAPAEAKPALHLRAAKEHAKGGRAREALGLLEGAADAGVRDGALLTELGELRVQAGRLSEAAAAYREAAAAVRDDPSLWELVAELHLKLGQLDEAEAAFRESLRLSDRAIAHVGLARACLARKDQGCAGAELDRALAAATGEELRETLDLAELLTALGRKRDALALLATAAEEPELKADARFQLRLAHLAQEAADGAVLAAACERARATDAGVTRCP